MDGPTLYCPTCGYNLTGLPENRCPECGIEFDPQKLLLAIVRGANPISPSGAFMRLAWLPVIIVSLAVLACLFQKESLGYLSLLGLGAFVFYGPVCANRVAKRLAVSGSDSDIHYSAVKLGPFYFVPFVTTLTFLGTLVLVCVAQRFLLP